MSIASEISRIQNAKASLKTSINAKTDAQHQINDENIDDYAGFVDSISGGSVDTTDLRTVVNMTGINTPVSTPYEDYPQTLYDGYINVLKNQDTLFNNMTKSTSTGSISEGLGLPVYEMKATKLSTQNTNVLPSEYQQLTYIESTGTQYIDSSFAPTSNSKVEFDWQAVSLSQTASPTSGIRIFGMGAIASPSANSTRFAIGIDNTLTQIYYGVGATNNNFTLPTGQTLYDRMLSFIDLKNSTCGQNGTTYNISNVDFINPNKYTAFLFARRGTGGVVEGQGDIKVFDVKFYEDNVLVKHFIPVKKISNNEVGMFEIYEQKFYANDGTGDFVAGSVVSSIDLPNPKFPIPINVVKGNTNLFDDKIELGSINPDTGALVTNNARTRSMNYIKVEPNTTYSITRTKTDGFRWIVAYDQNKNGVTDGNYDNHASALGMLLTNKATGTFRTSPTTQYIKWYDTSSTDLSENVMINEGSVPFAYGESWIYITITDGVNTKKTPIFLNNNEICGIGTYKDELVIDKVGHCYLNKKIGKITFNGTESWNFTNNGNAWYISSWASNNNAKVPASNDDLSNSLSNYFINIAKNDVATETNGIGIATNGEIDIKHEDYLTSSSDFTTWLSSHNTILYYILETPTTIDLNQTIDLTLYEGANTITNSENADMEIKYIKDTYE